MSLGEPNDRYFVYFISEKTKLEDQWPKKEKRTSAGKGRERLQPIEGNTDNSLQKENTIGKTGLFFFFLLNLNFIQHFG